MVISRLRNPLRVVLLTFSYSRGSYRNPGLSYGIPLGFLFCVDVRTDVDAISLKGFRWLRQYGKAVTNHSPGLAGAKRRGYPGIEASTLTTISEGDSKGFASPADLEAPLIFDSHGSLRFTPSSATLRRTSRQPWAMLRNGVAVFFRKSRKPGKTWRH